MAEYALPSDVFISYLSQAVQTARQINSMADLAWLIHPLAEIYRQRGYLISALELWAEALLIEKTLEDVSGQARSMLGLGEIHSEQGDFLHGKEYLSKALELYRELQDKEGITKALASLEYANVVSRIQQGRFTVALEYLERSRSTIGSLPIKWQEIQYLIAGSRSSATPAVLAEYFITANGAYLFGVRADWKEPKVVEIKMSLTEIRSEVARLFGNVYDENGKLIESGTDKIFNLNETNWQAIFGPFIEPLGEWSLEGEIVWLVPHDALHYLPLHALKLDGQYLIERNPVVYSPNASIMKYCQLKRKGRHQNALVLGDPDGTLENARDEARLVADLFQTRAYLRGEATKELVKAKLDAERQEIDVLHFACPASFDRFQPLKSKIVLAKNGDADPNLTAEEIFRLEMRAELVVLSGSETGVNDRRPGDELVGLSSAFIYAGTSSLIASLWDIHDLSTQLLMQTFYELWLEENETPITKAEALQQAQLAILRMTVEQALQRIARLYPRADGEDVERRTAYLDWIKAFLLAEAGEIEQAVALGKDAMTRMEKTGKDTEDFVQILERWEDFSGVPIDRDYTRRVFNKPYFWAPFILIGDWG